MSANNYFKVRGFGLHEVYPFDETGMEQAFARADAKRKEHDAEPFCATPAVISSWRTPKLKGAWAKLPLIGEVEDLGAELDRLVS